MKILEPKDFPDRLNEIPDPPKKLYIEGELPARDHIFLAVIGTRKYTNYGADICKKLIAGLAGYPVVIVSGIALGLDAIAHQAALESGLKTIAIPGTGLSQKAFSPKTNWNLAKRIVEKGGALISEYEEDFGAALWTFPKRNRIVAGISHAILVIEAPEKSGALITARMATDYNRDVLAVPGSLFSENSKGTHLLLRLGATLIRNSTDILDALGIVQSLSPLEGSDKKVRDDLSKEELKILELLREPMARDELIRESGFNAAEINISLTILELKGYIKESMGEVHKI